MRARLCRRGRRWPRRRLRQQLRRPREALQPLRRGRLGGRADGGGEEGLGGRASVLPADHRRLPPEPAPGRRPDRPRRHLSGPGWPRQLDHGGLGLPRVPDPLPLRPPGRLRPVPGGRVLLPAEEQARPRPDGHAPGPRRVPAAPRRVPQLRSTSSRRGSGSRSAARPWPRRPSTWATSTRRPGRPGGRPSAATRPFCAEYPDYEHLDEVLFRLGEALGATARYAEARPIWPASSRSTRRARGSPRPRRSSRRCRRWPCPWPPRPPQPTARRRRLPPRPTPGRSRKRPRPRPRGRGPTAGTLTSSVTLGNRPKSP